MTCEYQFYMEGSGNQQEVISIIHVLQKYAAGEKGVYLNIYDDGFTELTEEEIIQDCTQKGDTFEFEIDGFGPYGHVWSLNDADIFRDAAEAAPNASFSAEIKGGSQWDEQELRCELKNGLLITDTVLCDTESNYQSFLKMIAEKLPLQRLLTLFKISTTIIESDYIDFLKDSGFADFFYCYNDLDYVSLMELLGNSVESALQKDEYNDLIDAIRVLGIQDYEAYKIESADKKHFVYDPVKKAYVGEIKNVNKAREVSDATEFIRAGLKKTGQPADDETIAALSLEEAYAAAAIGIELYEKGASEQ